MPEGDGTGPFGTGAETGRRMGWCKGFFLPRRQISMRRFGMIGGLIPIAGALMRDALNPQGILRSVSNKLLASKNPVKWNTIDAEYTVIDEKINRSTGYNGN